MSVIIKNDTNTFTADFENVREEPIINANTVTTIGGMVKSQADSERLKIKTTLRVTQTELQSLNAILTNFSKQLKYTPSRLLYDRTSIEEIDVILKRAPKIEQRAWDGNVVFYITLDMEEVLDL
ncbi:MAG: hypothetical protein GWP19_00385 [Planctomycetia bacterium]|nr:hypothetical protein [Planctomycetia bacterium]